MATTEAPARGPSTCPYVRPIKGSCDHEHRTAITEYRRAHPDAPCPVFEAERAGAMRRLARRLD